MKQSSMQTAPLPSWNDGAKQRVDPALCRGCDIRGRTRSSCRPWIASPSLTTTARSGQRNRSTSNWSLPWSASRRWRVSTPSGSEQQPFKAVLEDDIAGVLAGGMQAIFEILVATHGGDTSDEFEQMSQTGSPARATPDRSPVHRDGLPAHAGAARVPAGQRIQTYIVSGGGIEFMRAWVEGVYGIPPEQVIGSTIETRFKKRESGPVLVRIPEVDFVDDGEGKPMASTSSSAAARSWPLATRTATCRCYNGRRPATGRASWAWSTTPTPSGSGPTTGSRRWAGWTKRWTRPWKRAGPCGHGARVARDLPLGGSGVRRRRPAAYPRAGQADGRGLQPGLRLLLLPGQGAALPGQPLAHE